MKKYSRILWGIVFVVASVIYALNALDIAKIDIFFDGWWTLIIIIPCFIGLFREKEKTGNLIGILVGVLLLLACQDVIQFSHVWKMGVPTVIMFIGIRLILSGIFKKQSDDAMEKLEDSGAPMKNGTAVFSGINLEYDGQTFGGAEYNAVFGGITCDMRSAVINSDCVINARAVFGGIDIFVPDDVNVKLHSVSIFGGAEDKKKNNSPDHPHTIYIKCICIFGGLDVK